MVDNTESLNEQELSIDQKLALAEDRIVELESDIEHFAFVNHEIMKLFGLNIEDILNNEIKQGKIFKAIKSRLLEAMTDEEGFTGLVSHFANDAVYIGNKYHKLAIEVSEKRAKNHE